jgi:hypothetical protein
MSIRKIFGIFLISAAVLLHILRKNGQYYWIDSFSAIFFCVGLFIARDRVTPWDLPESETCQNCAKFAKIGMEIIVIDVISAFILLEFINRSAVVLIFLSVAFLGFFLVGRYVACLSRESRRLF